MRFAIFLMIDATELWLRLARGERSKISDDHIGRALAARPMLRMRHFDAEAFSGECSDVMMIETDDLAAYYDFMETLRDSPLLTAPYFRVVRIWTTIEEGYRAYEQRAAPG